MKFHSNLPGVNDLFTGIFTPATDHFPCASEETTLKKNYMNLASLTISVAFQNVSIVNWLPNKPIELIYIKKM